MDLNHGEDLYFEVRNVMQPIFTNGDASIDSSGEILAACVGEDALITNIRTGEALCRIPGDGEILTSLKITPDARHIILCSRSLSMRIYRLLQHDERGGLDAQLLKRLKPHNTPVVTSSVDHTSTLLATGSADGSIKVWDIQGGYATHTFKGHSGIVSALKFFETSRESTNWTEKPQKRRSNGSKTDLISNNEEDVGTNVLFKLASGGDDGVVRVWNLVKRTSIVLNSHVSVVRGLDFSPSQNALLSSSRDRTFIIWDAQSWKPRKVVPAIEVLEDSKFINNGRFICTGGEKGYLRIWHTDSGRELTKEQDFGSETDTITGIIKPYDSNELISIRADQVLSFHQLDDLLTLDDSSKIDAVPLVRRISGTYDEVIDLTYVTPHRDILAMSTNSESVSLIGLRSEGRGQRNHESYFGSDIAQLRGHRDIVICLDVDWSGCWLATGGKDNEARLWRIDSNQDLYECYATFTGHTESLGAIGLPKTIPQSSSKAYLDPLGCPPPFLITGSQDRTIKRWSIDTSRGEKSPPYAVYTRKAHEKDINAISVSPDGKLFASASQDRTVKIWATENGEVQGILKGHKRGVWSVAFAPEQTPTILGDDGSRLSTRKGVILTGSGDKTVKVWSLSDFSCLRTFEGHTNTVLKVMWLPPRSMEADASSEMEESSPAEKKRSAIAVSAGSDGLVRLWNVQSGEPSAILDNHTDRIWALAAHPSNGTIVSGGSDSVVTFWKDTTTSKAAAKEKAITIRVEQEQELSNHVHRGNYREAIVLALTLNHPGRLLELFKGIVKGTPENESLSGLKAVDKVIAELSDDQLYTLLLRLRDWNTNAGLARVTQRILRTVIISHSRERVIALARDKKRRGLGDVLDGLRVYTDRHYRRAEELLEESYIIDFVVRGMGDEAFVPDVGTRPHSTSIAS